MKKEEKVKSAEEVLNSKAQEYDYVDIYDACHEGDSTEISTIALEAMEAYHSQQLKAYQEKLIEELEENSRKWSNKFEETSDGQYAYFGAGIVEAIKIIKSQQKQ